MYNRRIWPHVVKFKTLFLPHINVYVTVIETLSKHNETVEIQVVLFVLKKMLLHLNVFIFKAECSLALKIRKLILFCLDSVQQTVYFTYHSINQQ